TCRAPDAPLSRPAHTVRESPETNSQKHRTEGDHEVGIELVELLHEEQHGEDHYRGGGEEEPLEPYIASAREEIHRKDERDDDQREDHREICFRRDAGGRAESENDDEPLADRRETLPGRVSVELSDDDVVHESAGRGEEE